MDDFQSRCEIEESFEQFVESYSKYHVKLTSTSYAKFTQAPGVDACSASSAAVMHAIGLLRNK